MAVTIEPGLWMIPALITVASIIWYRWATRDIGPGAGAFGGNGVARAFMLMPAVIVDLAAWLIWALVR